jgi:LmbE family N-acetylglucosaminyl deacetylase
MTKGTALIVTAHPDDEAMFFGPTIQHLVQDGTSVNVLCLSTGVDHAIAAAPGFECDEISMALCMARLLMYLWCFTGNAEGLGRVRRDELLYACAELGVRRLYHHATIFKRCLCL